MPVRSFSRSQAFLFPPSLEEMVADEHPVRFAATLVDGLRDADWRALGVDRWGAMEGAPGYDARLLLSVWVYGFMSGVRSSRALERACREQLPFLWLTNAQRPDHNTLWRFYQAHRDGMRVLLRSTIQTAVKSGLIDLALQAVDGTKIGANAAKVLTFDAAGLEHLLARVEAAITELESQNAGGDEPAPATLPAELAQQEALRERVLEALAAVLEPETPARRNLTDADAQLLHTAGGWVLGYNAQLVVSPAVNPAVSEHPSMLITTCDVTTSGVDSQHLVGLLDAAAAETGTRSATVADAAYHSGPNLEACAEREQTIAVPETLGRRLEEPFHKAAFTYQPETDTFRCPAGQVLEKRGTTSAGKLLYRAPAALCQVCPSRSHCTSDRQGRALRVSRHDVVLTRHRAWMRSEEAQALFRRRKTLVEPVFGILKEVLGVRRFLLRGLSAARAEWTLLATAFNLRTLWRLQTSPRPAPA